MHYAHSIGDWKLSKKLTAIFLVLIFALSTALIAIPVQAHFTLGRPTGTIPYRVRDFDRMFQALQVMFGLDQA